jgi:leucyl aminopeptidase (aminopeptidase T)
MIETILRTNFSYKKGEKIIFLNDILKKSTNDIRFREKLCKEWHDKLEKKNYAVSLARYPATYSNNADLPDFCYIRKKRVSFKELFSHVDIVLFLTEYSATAPLNKYAKKYNFRAASMPGFNKNMISALNIDFKDLKKKIGKLYRIFEDSDSAEIIFKIGKKDYKLFLDLSTRKPLKDDGCCKEKGKVINLPSGECFIPPLDINKSRTKGYLPIQEGKEVIIYNVEKNKIIGATKNTELLKKIKEDPAIGNIAEFAFGILGLYGIKSTGKVLLDEKLGMHIALGRNDHFKGNIGPESFKKKDNIWHQDYVYIKEMQPKIKIKSAVIRKKKDLFLIMENNNFRIF